jgi:chromosome segregation ATPase
MKNELCMSVKMSENDKKRWDNLCNVHNGTNKDLMSLILDAYETSQINLSDAAVGKNLALLLDKIDHLKKVAINIHQIAKAESEDYKEQLSNIQVENQKIIDDLKVKLFTAKSEIKTLSEDNKSLIEIKTSRDQIFKTCENMQIVVDDYQEKVKKLESIDAELKNEIKHANKVIENFKVITQEKGNEIFELKNALESKNFEINSLKDKIEALRGSMQNLIFEKDSRIDDLKGILEKYQNSIDPNKKEIDKQEV